MKPNPLKSVLFDFHQERLMLNGVSIEVFILKVFFKESLINAYPRSK